VVVLREIVQTNKTTAEIYIWFVSNSVHAASVALKEINSYCPIQSETHGNQLNEPTNSTFKNMDRLSMKLLNEKNSDCYSEQNTHSILVTLFSVQLNAYRNCSSVAFLYTSLDLMFICCRHNRFLHGVDYC
jgi:hypothetical protein